MADDGGITDFPVNAIKTVEGMIPLLSANVNSSFIASVHYNIKTGDLTMTFKDGDRHTYADVPVDVYVGFMLSGSKGGYFNANIRKNYSTS